MLKNNRFENKSQAVTVENDWLHESKNMNSQFFSSTVFLMLIVLAKVIIMY